LTFKAALAAAQRAPPDSGRIALLHQTAPSSTGERKKNGGAYGKKAGRELA